ncbi:hypothetical protein CA13_42580 [Planctomycetes bacterium CA13]|uniref:Uncharacterized protein n=1 Tax=Novipirellula herctigrandis TaxID=2527986 RepID=A0A5C5Z6F1_9BACT|nr:hypothetical protein CA13_42580 [Planctomycetes bacterium CA13]
MDAGKILGAMIGQRVGRGGANGKVLSRVLEGIAAAADDDHCDHVDPRFTRDYHPHYESMVRDSVVRHHRSGGRYPADTDRWLQQHYPPAQHPPSRQRPHSHRPQVNYPTQPHPSGLECDRRAEVLILAMIMAVQADGRVDQRERDKIIEKLYPLDQFEIDFLRREFDRIHRISDLAGAVPRGMEYEVYAVSLLAMDVDTRQELMYLRTLANALNIDPRTCNQMHRRYGAPTAF